MAEKTPEEIAIEWIDSAYADESEVLDLTGLNLTFLPADIKRLTKLKSLRIKHTSITSLPDEVMYLKNLTSLVVTHSRLKVIENISELSNLKRLDLTHNNIKKIPTSISNLKKLEYLYLKENRINEIPEEVCELSLLTVLDLDGSKVEGLPKAFSKLTSLKTLDLYGNNLNHIPKIIFELSGLEKLYIGNNQISEIPYEISHLENLAELLLSSNKISEIPFSLTELKKLQKLNLRGNPLNAPPEILDKISEPQSIINYFLNTGNVSFPDFDHELYTPIKKEFVVPRRTKFSVNECKILIIGQGSVGKTSIVKRITKNNFQAGELKTEGISINNWQVENLIDVEKPKIQLNLWDFGGQEIMHATHQFFLTKRSLYLLVLDSRLTQEENRVEYWLKIIQSFGGESPVLLVGNKIDQHPLDIDRTGLQKKYPNIVGILETSAAIGAGIEELKAAITEQVNNLPHVRDLLPETWFTVKTKLEELGRQSNFITHDKYLELCAENEVSDETSQRTLIGFLHDLGVVLHFQDDPRLEALGILNPQWVTNGVYKILNSHTLFQNKGVLTTSMLDEILNLPEYPRGKRLFIVDMMKKFELCYDIEPDKTFLVPDLLPKDEPAELKFNGVPAFEYAYPVLPSSVITRFIVRMNQKIDDSLVWRTGVVLKIGENKALVKADIEDRKITIAIDGVEHTRRDALSTIRTHLDDIHNSIKSLNPEKFVPVPGADKAKPLPYNYLLMLEAKGIEILPAQDGDRLVEVNVRQVLSGVESEIQRREQQGSVVNNIFVGGNVSGNLVVGDKNEVIQNSYNKIKSADISPELKDTMKQLAEAVDAMIQKLPAEQAAEVAEDFGKLADEAVKPKPNQKWYSVSIEGLIKAAENLDKLGTPVISLSQKVLSLLTGGVVK